MDLAAVKARLADVPGIEALSLTFITGRAVFGMGGKIAAVGESASDAAADAAIRRTFGSTSATATPTSQERPMTGTPNPGSFAASIRAMMDEARAGVQQARADGIAQVKDAVGKLNEAKVATTHVAGSMAKTLEDEAASVMSELGQISNDLG